MESPAIMEEQDAVAAASLQNRIKAVQKKIQAATLDSAPPTGTTWQENDDPNASFHLGMELFGQDVSVVEKKVQENLQSLERELQDVVTTMDQSTRSSRQSPNDSANVSTEQLEQDAQQLRQQIEFLRGCSAARAALDESVTLATPALSAHEPNLKEAARHVVEARRALDRARQVVQTSEEEDSNSEESPSPAVMVAYRILDSIQASIRRQKVELMSRTKTLWHTSVSLASNDSLEVREGSSTAGLAAAYDNLELFADDGSSALQEILHKFVKTLHKDVFLPLLSSENTATAAWKFHETEDRASSASLGGGRAKGPIRRLEWSRQDDEFFNSVADELSGGAVTTKPANSLATWKETMAFFQRLLAFVADHVCLNRPTLCELIGKLLFGRPDATSSPLNLGDLGLDSYRIDVDHGLLMDPLVKAMNDTCVPSYLEPSELGQLDSLAAELRSFVDPLLSELASKGLLSGGDSRLALFSSKFHQMYEDHRRCIILNEARDILLKNDYHNTVEVGVDANTDEESKRLGLDDGMSVFLLHKSSISDSASKLMDLCRRTMDEAVAVPSGSTVRSLPMTLYRAAREVLDLYRAIIPVTYGSEISSLPRTAAVLHNDCVFFAHHCLTLGLEYKDRFPSLDSEDPRSGLVQQCCIFVDMVPLFRQLAERAMGDMLETQARQLTDLVAERITLLSQALRSNEILAEWSEAETALTAGLYHMRHLFHAWKPVLSQEILSRSMCYLADVIFTLYLEQVFKATDISANASNFVSSLFAKASHDIGELVNGDKSGSRSWDRFDAVGRFMNMSLADIQVGLSDGVFFSVTGPELTRLIMAAFDNTPKRAEVLKLLAN